MQTEICQFPICGKPVDCRELKSGHINTTYLICTDAGKRYILQRVNSYVFPDIRAIMGNVSAVSRFLAERGGAMTMIRYMDTVDGESWYDDGKGGIWRAYPYVEHSFCPERAESAEMLRLSGEAFGRFQQALNGFPVSELQETIRDFHNTPVRFRQLREAADADASCRLSAVRGELDFAFAREERGGTLCRMLAGGELPLRVTHNDTKITNVLFHEETGEPICVIDLDTVMPGLSAYDYGDAIRYGASTAAEDAEGEMDMELFRAFTRGFLTGFPSIGERELEVLPLGAWTMTLECGIRFLADYLNGDRYFTVSDPEQNLRRARAQFRLLRSMEAQAEAMRAAVREEKGNIIRRDR